MNGARIRTLIVAVGLGFSAAALGTACLDYAGEDFGLCSTPPPTGGSTGAGSAQLGAGSGSGSGSAVPALTIDCGTITLKVDSGAASSGSASP
jgi:hypothetical protein